MLPDGIGLSSLSSYVWELDLLLRSWRKLHSLSNLMQLPHDGPFSSHCGLLSVICRRVSLSEISGLPRGHMSTNWLLMYVNNRGYMEARAAKRKIYNKERLDPRVQMTSHLGVFLLALQTSFP